MKEFPEEYFDNKPDSLLYNVWHSVSKEKPEPHANCLVRGVVENSLTHKEYSIYFVSWFDYVKFVGECDWNISCLPNKYATDKLKEITHWAYLSDILPLDLIKGDNNIIN